jgi:2-polyprenyl-6-methoxyphenol hydroxylase-like FAD-dependent oxidoreductase
MLIDARELQDEHVIESDICIVGGGAAGISMALALAGTPWSVTLLESGGAPTHDADVGLDDVFVLELSRVD